MTGDIYNKKNRGSIQSSEKDFLVRGRRSLLDFFSSLSFLILSEECLLEALPFLVTEDAFVQAGSLRLLRGVNVVDEGGGAKDRADEDHL